MDRRLPSRDFYLASEGTVCRSRTYDEPHSCLCSGTLFRLMRTAERYQSRKSTIIYSFIILQEHAMGTWLLRIGFMVKCQPTSLLSSSKKEMRQPPQWQMDYSIMGVMKILFIYFSLQNNAISSCSNREGFLRLTTSPGPFSGW